MKNNDNFDKFIIQDFLYFVKNVELKIQRFFL